VSVGEGWLGESVGELLGELNLDCATSPHTNSIYAQFTFPLTTGQFARILITQTEGEREKYSMAHFGNHWVKREYYSFKSPVIAMISLVTS